LGFDSDFFLNHEDIELCDRVRALGKQIHVLPNLTVLHHDGGTQRLNWKRFVRDRLNAKWIYLHKRFHGIALLCAQILWWEGVVLRILVGAVLLRGTQRSRLKGYFEAMRARLA
jgi:GT2 family glycosyltransferase